MLTSATLTIGGTFDAMASAWGLAGDDDAGPVARHRRRIAVRAREVGHPLRRRPSPAAGSRRHRLGRTARRDRRARHRRGRPHARPVLVDARGEGRRRDHAGPPRHPGPVPGRGHHVGAGEAVRRRCRDVTVRDAVAVAGRRRSGPVAVAGAHRPHPVPPPRRSAADGAPARGGRPRRQRFHGGRRQPRGAAAGAGRRPIAAHASTTAASSRCWTPGWPPPATAGYLRASLPPFWATTDAIRVRQALERLRAV